MRDCGVDGATLAITVAVAIVVVVPEFALLNRRRRRRTPFGVVKRLRVPGESHSFQMRALDPGGIWNPGKPWGMDNLLYGPGRATYTLRSDGEVSLDWVPRYGSPVTVKGPIPPLLRQGGLMTPSARRLAWLVASTYLTLTAAGFVIGWLMSGVDVHSRAAWGGAALGLVAAHVLLLLVRPLVKRVADQ